MTLFQQISTLNQHWVFAGNLHLSSTEINYEKILKIEQRVDEYVLRVPYLRKIMLTGGRCHNTYKGKRIGKFEERTNYKCFRTFKLFKRQKTSCLLMLLKRYRKRLLIWNWLNYRGMIEKEIQFFFLFKLSINFSSYFF